MNLFYALCMDPPVSPNLSSHIAVSCRRAGIPTPHVGRARWIFKSQRGRTHLHLDIQNARPSLLGNVLNSFDGRAVVIPRKVRILDEALLRDEVFKLRHGDKVVLNPVLLRTSRLPRRVWRIFPSGTNS